MGVALLCGACSSGQSSAPSIAPNHPNTATTRSAVNLAGLKAAVVYGWASPIGTILAAPVLSTTVYSNVHDSAQVSTCSGGCASKWAPLTSSGAPISGGGINPVLLGTLVRPDGRHQVTYGGHPLYTYSGDKQHLGLAGQGVDASWFVISPSGDFVKGTR
jgi:predicted lipoprotein with Yx(FWY)xxD motif